MEGLSSAERAVDVWNILRRAVMISRRRRDSETCRQMTFPRARTLGIMDRRSRYTVDKLLPDETSARTFSRVLALSLVRSAIRQRRTFFYYFSCRLNFDEFIFNWEQTAGRAVPENDSRQKEIRVTMAFFSAPSRLSCFIQWIGRERYSCGASPTNEVGGGCHSSESLDTPVCWIIRKGARRVIEKKKKE